MLATCQSNGDITTRPSSASRPSTFTALVESVVAKGGGRRGVCPCGSGGGGGGPMCASTRKGTERG